jgi:hypothetical protein
MIAARERERASGPLRRGRTRRDASARAETTPHHTDDVPHPSNAKSREEFATPPEKARVSAQRPCLGDPRRALVRWRVERGVRLQGRAAAAGRV